MIVTTPFKIIIIVLFCLSNTKDRPIILHMSLQLMNMSKNALCLQPMQESTQHIQRLIEEGEHQQLDFKFEISDSKRIARSFAAFANTDGGRLLIGVKDNGAIAGIRSDEELFMIEAAAEMYCQPPVLYSTEEWEINGKTVLEVIIPKDDTGIKHKAPDNQDNYKYFVRVRDKNIVANGIMLRIWKYKNNKISAQIAFNDAETLLLRHLNQYETITQQTFQNIAHINKKKAEAILCNFILMGTITMELSEKETIFRLTDD